MWKYAQLSETLAGLYNTIIRMESILRKAGLKPERFMLTGTALDCWVLILGELENMNKIEQLLDTVIKDYPDNPILMDYKNNSAVVRKSVFAGDKPAWKADLTKDEYEKIIGDQSTLLPISFLEMGMRKSQCVARVITPEGMGSGFLISKDNHFLTNNHVFNTQQLAGKSTVEFNYQKTASGLAAPVESLEVDNSVFATSIDDDWSVVKIKGNPAAKYGFLNLAEQKIEKDTYVNIIQHPGGGYKQLGLYHNVVAFVDDSRVQYLTDTMPGSSGSPVFNSDWEVVALHHSGGFFKDAATGERVLRNEGININKVIAGLKANGINL